MTICVGLRVLGVLNRLRVSNTKQLEKKGFCREPFAVSCYRFETSFYNGISNSVVALHFSQTLLSN